MLLQQLGRRIVEVSNCDALLVLDMAFRFLVNEDPILDALVTETATRRISRNLLYRRVANQHTATARPGLWQLGSPEKGM